LHGPGRVLVFQFIVWGSDEPVPTSTMASGLGGPAPRSKIWAIIVAVLGFCVLCIAHGSTVTEVT
jgi:hypothetical protein